LLVFRQFAVASEVVGEDVGGGAADETVGEGAPVVVPAALISPLAASSEEDPLQADRESATAAATATAPRDFFMVLLSVREWDREYRGIEGVVPI
jgi:hypothetical protein